MKKALFLGFVFIMGSSAVLLFLLGRFNIEGVFAQDNLIWVKTSSPSGGNDAVEGITSDDTYIYVVGADGWQWRIEKRQKSDGSLVWTKTSNPSSDYDRPRSITSDDTHIYVVGFDSSPGNRQWRIEKRQKSDGSLVWAKTNNPSGGMDSAWGIVFDDTYIYVAGYDSSLGNTQWRIEKRQKSDGNLIWTQTNNYSSGYDEAWAITADSVYLYIVGHDSSLGGYQWRIEKRQKSDGSLVWAKTNNPSGGNDVAYSVTTDNSYLYIAGYDSSGGNYQWRIEKRQKSDGSLVWAKTNNPSSSHDVASELASDDVYLYIVGGDSSGGNYQWRIEKRQKSDGNLIWTEINNPSGDYDLANSVTIDSAYLYIGGIDSSLGHYQWRMEKRGKTAQTASTGYSGVIDYIRAQGPRGLINLSVVSVNDAVSAGKGVVKVNMPSGIAAADLVETSHVDASPVRLRTPYGTKAWRECDLWAVRIGVGLWDRETKVIQTSDGGLAVTGHYYNGSDNGYDNFLVKLTSDASVQWTRLLYNVGYDEFVSDILQTSDGGYLIVGTRRSKDTNGTNDIYLVKFNSSGAVQWAKVMDYGCCDNGNSIIELNNGTFLVAGDLISFESVFINIDSSGNVLWSKKTGPCSPSQLIQTSDGGYAVAGFYYDLNHDACIMKLNSSANVQWARRFRGSGWDYFNTIIQASDGGYLIGGNTSSDEFSVEGYDYLLVKVNSAGTFQWAKTINRYEYGDYWRAIIPSADGNYIGVGGGGGFVSSPDMGMTVAKINPSGNILWFRTAGSPTDDCGSSVIPVYGGYVVTGDTEGFGASGSDVFIVKFLENGLSCLGDYETPTVISRSNPLTDLSRTSSDVSLTVTVVTPNVFSPSPNVHKICD